MFDFVGKRKISYAVIIFILLLGVVFFFVNNGRHNFEGGVSLRNGFNLGLQFSGGSEITYQMENGDFNEEEAAEVISDVVKREVTVQKSERLDQQAHKIHFMVIRVSSGAPLAASELDDVEKVLEDNGFTGMSNEEITNIQPAMGTEYLMNALLALFVALLLILIFIAFRYSAISGWSTGIITSLSIILDSLVLIAIYVIFYIPINDSFIAALLTLIGYSINDKVVIFDRVRENHKFRRKGSFSDLVNISIKQSLRRTINDSTAVIISVLVIYVIALYYNLASIQEFCFPLLFGFIFSCASSIFITAPMFGAWKEATETQRRR